MILKDMSLILLTSGFDVAAELSIPADTIMLIDIKTNIFLSNL